MRASERERIVAALETKAAELRLSIHKWAHQAAHQIDDIVTELSEAVAAAVPPEKSPDVELYEAQERFVDARRAAAVPQPLCDSPVCSVAPVAHPHTPSCPAVPQPPRDLVDEAVETRAREAMIEPTSANKLSGRWEAPAVPQGEPPRRSWTECYQCGERDGQHAHGCEPTPAPQREPSSHFTCDHYGPCDCVSDGSHLCPSEAPPPGEPTPDRVKRIEALLDKHRRELVAEGGMEPHIELVYLIADQVRRLAAQPAPASPHRDESVPPRGWVPRAFEDLEARLALASFRLRVGCGRLTRAVAEKWARDLLAIPGMSLESRVRLAVRLRVPPRYPRRRRFRARARRIR